MSALWRVKWTLARLAIVGFLLYAMVADTGARLARLQYASLPEFDYAGEVAYLRAEGRYGEAIVVADAGLALAEGGARERISAERAATLREQRSHLRRARDLGMGALSGRGESLEGLIGAVTADFFVVGDVRDLLIQGSRLVVDGETDEVILVLSGVGLATTLAPEVDWVPSILKAARKTGAMTKGLADHILKVARAGKHRELMPLLRDVRRLSGKLSPGGTVRALRHADSPQDVARLASFLERQPAGAFALHVAGGEAAAVAKGAGRAGGAAQEVAEAALVKAARKGSPGVAWFRAGGYKALARPHLLVGIAKALRKGNAEELAARIGSLLDPRARWLVPALAAWFFVELALVVRGVLRPRYRVWPAAAAL